MDGLTVLVILFAVGAWAYAGVAALRAHREESRPLALPPVPRPMKTLYRPVPLKESRHAAQG